MVYIYIFLCFLLYVLYSLQALSKRAPSSPTYWSAHSQQWPNMNTPNASNASLTFENRLANRSDMHCYALYCIYCCIRLYPFNSFDFTCINSLYFVYATAIRVNTCARTCMWRHVFGQELWYFPWALLSGPGADRRILDLFDQHCGNAAACKRYIKISDILFGNAV